MIRNVKKNLVGMQDIAQGLGDTTQTRNSASTTITKLDVPYSVATEAEMQDLDIAVYTRSRVYSTTVLFTDYIYDPAAVAGVSSNTGAGYWVKVLLVAADVKTSYESNADTNAFTDAEKAKLAARTINMDNVNTRRLGNPVFHVLKKNSAAHTLTGALTWTRSTSKTYKNRQLQVKTAAIDTEAEEPTGWAIAPAATNIVLRAKRFDNASWTKGAATVTPNSVNGPDGLLTADTLTADGTNATHNMYQAATCVAETVYTMYVDVKAGTEDTVVLFEGLATAARATFDLTAETAVLGTSHTANPSGLEARIEKYTDGYYRCSLVFITDPAQVSMRFYAYLGTTSAEVSIKDMYFAGAQFQLGNKATALIETVASPVTATTDIVNALTADNVPYLEDFSIVCQVENLQGFTGTNRYICSIETLAGLCAIYADSASNVITARVDNGTSTTVSVAFTPYALTNIALTYDATTLTLVVNRTVDTIAATATPSVDTTGKIFIGMSDAAGTEALGANLTDLQFYDYVLNTDTTSHVTGV